MTDRKNAVIAASVLAILVLILLLLRVAGMYSDEHQRAVKLEAQLTKAEDKLDYYIWRARARALAIASGRRSLMATTTR